MSKENNHNDPLERLFRKKAEEYDFSYREEDWLKLEKQLDSRDLKLYYRRRFRWLAVASILILSLIGYYTIQNHNKIDYLTEQLNNSEQVQQNNRETPAQSNSGPIQEDAQTSESTVPPTTHSGRLQDSQIPDPNNVGNIQSDRGVPSVLNDEPEIIADRSEDENSTGFADSRAQIRYSDALQTVQVRHVEPSLFRASEFARQTQNQINTEANQFDEDKTHFAEIRNSNGELISGAKAIQTAPSSSQNEFSDTQSRTTFGSRFAVGVVVSPDLSTAGGLSNFDTPGFKGGIMAEYAVTKNISIVSGLAFSNVKYHADGSAYSPPQGWNYGVMPDRTRAVCLVLDIPVNLKANLFNFSRSRVFATTGLSSYIMMDEEYHFKYDGEQQGLQSSWNEPTGTKHWFSNLGLSIGFEYDVSPAFSIRAEPHIKIPLRGVGWGEVDLYSIGTFVSVNYRFSNL